MCEACRRVLGHHVYCGRGCRRRDMARAVVLAVARELPRRVDRLTATAVLAAVVSPLLLVGLAHLVSGVRSYDPRAATTGSTVRATGAGWQLRVEGGAGTAVLVLVDGAPHTVLELDRAGHATLELGASPRPPRVTLRRLGDELPVERLPARIEVAALPRPPTAPTPAPPPTMPPVAATATAAPTPVRVARLEPAPTRLPATPRPRVDVPALQPAPTVTPAATATPRPRLEVVALAPAPTPRPTPTRAPLRVAAVPAAPTPPPPPAGETAASTAAPRQPATRGPSVPGVHLVEDAGPRLALTFDGSRPEPGTIEVLDLLRELDVRTTLFVTGEFVRSQPALLRRAVLDGHEVGNHTDTHPRLTTYASDRRQALRPEVTREMFQAELRRTEEAFRVATGRPMAPLWRAPFGEENATLRAWAAELGYLHVRWSGVRGASLDSRDWVEDEHSPLYEHPRRMMHRLLGFPRLEGGIVLMHLASGREEPPWTILPELVAELRRRRLEPVTVSALLAASPTWAARVAELRSRHLAWSDGLEKGTPTPAR